MKKLARTLIIGAGEAGEIISAEFRRQGRWNELVGFIDDDINKKNSTIDDLPVLGNRQDVQKIIISERISSAIIALPSVSAEIINETVTSLLTARSDLTIQILPEITRYFNSSISFDLQDIRVSDLIPRQEIELDLLAIENNFIGKSILVTGAGGSIGSEICRQLLRFGVKRIIALGRGENSIYQLAKEVDSLVEEMEYKSSIKYVIADVKDYELLNKIIREEKPDFIFHAAAHKHVPLMEFNEAEAINNNIGGTNNVLKAAVANDIDKVILISTDKAVNPANVMGATKRVAELLGLHYYRTKGLKVSSVRFGNVLGSRGSVVPLFKEQIEKGGPLTLTHPEVKRFFMSIPEASLLVINAAAYCDGGESFVFNMGEQHLLRDIAFKLIKLYGLEPEKDIKIIYTGLRPGEKLYEELYYNQEDIINTDNSKIYILKENIPDSCLASVEKYINKNLPDLCNITPEAIRADLKKLVPEFQNQKSFAQNRMVK